MSIQMGQQFDSYDEFIAILQEFQQATRHRFIKHYQKTVQWAAQNNVNPAPQQKLRYYRLRMNCSRKETKATGDCGTYIRLGVTRDGEKLEIVALEMKECAPSLDQSPPAESSMPMMQPPMQPQPMYYDPMYPMEQYPAPPAQYDMNYQQPNQRDMQQGMQPLPSFGHLGGFPMGYDQPPPPQQYGDPSVFHPPQQGYQPLPIDYQNQPGPYGPQHPPPQMYQAPPPDPAMPMPVQPAFAPDPQMYPQGMVVQPQAAQPQPQALSHPMGPIDGAPHQMASSSAIHQVSSTVHHSPIMGSPQSSLIQSPQHMPMANGPQMGQPPAQIIHPMAQGNPMMQSYAPVNEPYPDMRVMQQIPPEMPNPQSMGAQSVHTHHMAHPHGQEQIAYQAIENRGAPGGVYDVPKSPQLFGNHLQKALMEGTSGTEFCAKPDRMPMSHCDAQDISSTTNDGTQVLHLRDLSTAPPRTGSPRKTAPTLEALLGSQARRTSGSSAASNRSRNSESDGGSVQDVKNRGPIPDLYLGQMYTSYKQAEKAVENYASPRGFKFRKIGSMLLKRIEGKEKLKEQFENAAADPGIKYFALKFRCVRSRQLTMVSNYVKKKRDDDGQIIEPSAEESAVKVPVGSCNARVTFQLNKTGTALEVKQLEENHDHEADEDVKRRFAKGLSNRTRTAKSKRNQIAAGEIKEENDDSKPPINNEDSFLNDDLLADQPEVDLLTKIKSLTEEIDKLSETDDLPADLDALRNEDLNLSLEIPEFDQKMVALQNGDIGRTVYDDKEHGVAVVKAEAKPRDGGLLKKELKRMNGHRHDQLNEEQVVPKDRAKVPKLTQSVATDQEEGGKAVPNLKSLDNATSGDLGPVPKTEDDSVSLLMNCSSRMSSNLDSPSDDDEHKSRTPHGKSTTGDPKKTQDLNANVTSLRKRSLKGNNAPHDDLLCPNGRRRLAGDRPDETATTLPNKENGNHDPKRSRDASDSDESQTQSNRKRSSRIRLRSKRNRTVSNGSVPEKLRAKDVADVGDRPYPMETRGCKVVVQRAELPKDFEIYWNQDDINRQLDEVERVEAMELLKSLESLIATSKGPSLIQRKDSLQTLFHSWKAAQADQSAALQTSRSEEQRSEASTLELNKGSTPADPIL